MPSERFRRQLRQEAQQWYAEGTIDAALYGELARRYRFEALEEASRNRFAALLFGLGGLLVGLAVITFVAANWQAMPKALKLGLLLGATIVAEAAGFYLWRSAAGGWRHRLGQGLLLLGALALGANLALGSQLFHQSGPLYQLYAAWAVGVAVMALGLRSALLAATTTLLVWIAYGTANSTEAIGLPLPSFERGWVQYTPLLAAGGLVPLAHWCRSRWAFGLAAALVVFSLGVVLLAAVPNDPQTLSGASAGMTALAFALPPALLWGYGGAGWEPRSLEAGAIARRLAIILLAGQFYIFSFRRVGVDLPDRDFLMMGATADPLPVGLNAAGLGGVALWGWWRLGRSGESGRVWWPDRASAATGAAIAAAAAIAGIHSFHSIGIAATVAFNGLLLALALSLLGWGLATARRSGFWGGLLLLVLQLTSRMLEYDTSLLLKAGGLLLCGAAILAAGLWFERRAIRPR